MPRILLAVCAKSLPRPFRRSLLDASRLGLRGIEADAIGEFDSTQLSQTARREIRHLLRSHDLELAALYCPIRRSLFEVENLEPRLDAIRNAMVLSFDLGARLIVVPPGEIPEKADDPRATVLRESLEALGQHGDRIGCRVALDVGLEKPEVVLEFISRIDSGSLGLHFNSANLLINRHSPEATARLWRRRIVYAHAQDARSINPQRIAPVPLGHGDIDWMQMLATLEEIEYRGFLTIAGAESVAEVEAGVGFLRRFVVE